MLKLRKLGNGPLGGAASLPVAPTKTGNPSISGTPQVGNTLTATHGPYTGTVTGYTQQWYSNGVAISGATGLTYVAQVSDVGYSITYRESAYNTNPSFSSSTGTSNALGPVTSGGGPAPALKFNVASNSQYVPVAAF